MASNLLANLRSLLKYLTQAKNICPLVEYLIYYSFNLLISLVTFHILFSSVFFYYDNYL